MELPLALKQSKIVWKNIPCDEYSIEGVWYDASLSGDSIEDTEEALGACEKDTEKTEFLKLMD